MRLVIEVVKDKKELQGMQMRRYEVDDMLLGCVGTGFAAEFLSSNL